MADIITILQSIFVHTETVEGTANGGFPTGSTDAVLAKGMTKPTPRQFNERLFAQAMGTRQGKIGAIDSASIAFQTELKGNGTTTVPEVSALLNSVFGKITTDSFASTSLTGVPTSTSLPYAGGTGTYSQGNGLLVETAPGSNVYEMVFITSAGGSTATGTITVSPALSFTPAADGRKLKATTTYTVQDTGHPSLSIYNYLSGVAASSQVAQYLGCRGNVKFSAKKAGDIPMLDWLFKAWNWTVAVNGTRPAPTYDTSIPPNALGAIFKIGGVKTDVLDFEWDLGNEVSLKLSQGSSTGGYGLPVTQRKTKGRFRVHSVDTTMTHFTDWQVNTQTTLSSQYGNKQFGTICSYAPNAERTNVAYGDDKGITSNDVSFNANISVGQDSFYVAVG